MSIRSPQTANRLAVSRRSYIPPASTIIQIHDHDCNCPACEPYVPSSPDTLTATAIGKLMVAGIVVGLVIIFAIDPAGAAAALLATIGL